VIGLSESGHERPNWFAPAGIPRQEWLESRRDFRGLGTQRMLVNLSN
jgi:hypothetical protein